MTDNNNNILTDDNRINNNNAGRHQIQLMSCILMFYFPRRVFDNMTYLILKWFPFHLMLLYILNILNIYLVYICVRKCDDDCMYPVHVLERETVYDA